MSNSEKHLQNYRKDYNSSSLSERDIQANPEEQFKVWMEMALAFGIEEPNAFVLSTVNENMQPSSRVVLLRGIDESGFKFYTNYQSRKGHEIECGQKVAMNFFWPAMEKQIRIEGVATKLSAAQSDQYFNSRPKESQLGAWASKQSSIIETRDVLEHKMTELNSQYQNTEVPRPEFWGGYGIKPSYFEFWQGRSNRLHDRITYSFEGNAWKIARLSP